MLENLGNIKDQNNQGFWKTKLHKFYHSFILEYPNAKMAHLSQKRTSDKAGRSVRKRPPKQITYDNGNKNLEGKGQRREEAGENSSSLFLILKVPVYQMLPATSVPYV